MVIDDVLVGGPEEVGDFVVLFFEGVVIRGDFEEEVEAEVVDAVDAAFWACVFGVDLGDDEGFFGSLWTVAVVGEVEAGFFEDFADGGFFGGVVVEVGGKGDEAFFEGVDDIVVGGLDVAAGDFVVFEIVAVFDEEEVVVGAIFIVDEAASADSVGGGEGDAGIVGSAPDAGVVFWEVEVVEELGGAEFGDIFGVEGVGDFDEEGAVVGLLVYFVNELDPGGGIEF